MVTKGLMKIEMEEYLLEWLPKNPILIVLISLTLNIIIAVSGVLPSAFLTAANIALFDFRSGLILSIIGEAVGAIISFVLYRKGLSKLTSHVQLNHKLLKKLQATKGVEAFLLVVILRIMPFVPSGVVTLAAAYSKMALISFCLASTLGKVPALFIEAYSVDRLLDLSTEWQIFSLVLGLSLFTLYYWVRKRKHA